MVTLSGAGHFENGKLGIARGLVNGIGFGSSEYFVFRTDQSLLPDYLQYFLSRDVFRAEGERVMGGAVGHKRVPKEFIEQYSIPVPPLPEQQRIVAILDEAFAGIASAVESAEKNLANAREVYQSRLNSIFSRPDDDWIGTTLGAICSFENGDRGKNYPGRKAFVPVGIPFINAGHLTESGIDVESMNYISRPSFAALNSGKVRFGDVLFCLRGSLGKFAVVEDIQEGSIASSLVIVRPGETLSYEFLLLYFGSDSTTKMIDEFSNGTAQPNLSVQSLKKFRIGVPSVEKQSLIASAMNDLRVSTNRLQDIYRQQLDDLAELKQSILQKAFIGELTAEPDKALAEAGL